MLPSPNARRAVALPAVVTTRSLPPSPLPSLPLALACSLAFSLALLTLLPFSIIVFFICIAVRVCT